MRMETISAPGATPGVSESRPMIMEATAVPWPFCFERSAGRSTRLMEEIELANAWLAVTPVSRIAMRTPFPQAELSPVMPSQSSKPAPSATAPACAEPSTGGGISTGKINPSSSLPSSRPARSSELRKPMRRALSASSRPITRTRSPARFRKFSRAARSVKMSERCPGRAPACAASSSRRKAGTRSPRRNLGAGSSAMTRRFGTTSGVSTRSRGGGAAVPASQ